ncbi:MAG: ribonuclease HII [Simkania sp.]|nr:ribonuclease HII [Simkania sp.]MCP5489975.1 ribonuclease HII [Chlamydiales bacterium]
MKTKYELTKLEEMAYQEGYQIIAGVDEAGRGPLAGPVVAAACIFPRGLVLEGVDDSKKLSPKKREEIYQILVSHPEIDFAIGIVEQTQIDVINILQASLAAMASAIKNLVVEPDFLLVDGNQRPPTEIACKAVVKGDSLSQSIAAASILAKHSRDQMMLQFHLEWPQYGFDKHKGYATRAHLQAIQKHGPCPIHRKSFEPLKSILAK